MIYERTALKALIRSLLDHEGLDMIENYLGGALAHHTRYLNRKEDTMDLVAEELTKSQLSEGEDA